MYTLLNRSVTRFFCFSLLTLTLLSTTTFAQENYSYPHNIQYDYGLLPTNANASDPENAYNEFKDNWVTSDGATPYQRVKSDFIEGCPTAFCTVSEGTGYGMLMAVNFADKEVFDDLWSFHKTRKNENGLLAWRIDDFGNISSLTSATDGDADVAYALLLADLQWGSGGLHDYLQDGLELIQALWDHAIQENASGEKTFVFKPWDVVDPYDQLNPSYLSPAYYRVFAEVSQNSGWLQVAEKSYEILENAAHPITGLVPEWSDSQGNQYGGQPYEYRYNAARTPWRISFDYIIYGTDSARILASKIGDFANDIGIDNVLDAYELDGQLITHDWNPELEAFVEADRHHNPTFVGPIATAMMAYGSEGQVLLNDAYDELKNLAAGTYYNSALKVLTLLQLTGNFISFESSSSTIDEGLITGVPDPIIAGESFQFTTEHPDLIDGKLELTIVHPEQGNNININYVYNTGWINPWGGSGFLDAYTATLTEENGVYKLDWTMTLNESWPEADSGIEFRIRLINNWHAEENIAFSHESSSSTNYEGLITGVPDPIIAGESFQFTTEHPDLIDGKLELTIVHPEQGNSININYVYNTGWINPWGGSGFLDAYTATLTEENGVFKLDWTMTLNQSWPEADSGIEFRIRLINNWHGEESVAFYHEDPGTASEAWHELRPSLLKQILPDSFTLHQNYPNPFNPQTTIAFGLAEPEQVRLTIYDINGRELQDLIDRPMDAGWHEVFFDASHLPSGTYFYRLKGASFQEVRSMILTK